MRAILASSNLRKGCRTAPQKHPGICVIVARRLRNLRGRGGLAGLNIQSSVVSSPPRVRFAPSPTGYLHVGGARTALFNWLFARRHGGVFVLRIEDTDVERSSPDMVEGILDGMRWLGLDWDEGPLVGGPYAPYFQSRAARSTTARWPSGSSRGGHAYYCYCTPDELKAQARRGGGEPAAPGSTIAPAARLTAGRDRRARSAQAGRAPCVSRCPTASMRFDDLVHGPIEFDSAHIEDFVILRSDGHPTYHLSVVSDDVEMRITHVVRGDDHISNTPKQMLLYQALGAPVPQFAHVPLILGAGQEAVEQAPRRDVGDGVRAAGLSARGDGQFSGAARLVARQRRSRGVHARRARRRCSTSRASAAATPCSTGKARLVQPAAHRAAGARGADARGSGRRSRPPACGTTSSWRRGTRGFSPSLELLKPRAKRLDDFATQGAFFFADDVEYDPAAVEKHLRAEGMAAHLAGARRRVLGAGRTSMRRPRGGAASGGRGAGRQGRDADPRGARGA